MKFLSIICILLLSLNSLAQDANPIDFEANSKIIESKCAELQLSHESLEELKSILTLKIEAINLMEKSQSLLVSKGFQAAKHAYNICSTAERNWWSLE